MENNIYDAWIKPVTDFLFVSDSPHNADCIFVPGSSDPEPAEHAANLYLSGFAPLILPSGCYPKPVGHFAGVRQDKKEEYRGSYLTEWELMHDILLSRGVPDSSILRQNQATYTWQNALFSSRVLKKMGIVIHSAILSCKPWHARRALGYYSLAFPDVHFIVSPCFYPDCNQNDWWKTIKGRQIVMGEIQRCGHQLGEQIFAYSPCLNGGNHE